MKKSINKSIEAIIADDKSKMVVCLPTIKGEIDSNSILFNYKIESFSSDIVSLSGLDSNTSLNELNYLAFILLDLEESDLFKVNAIIKYTDYVMTIKDLINVIIHLDEFELLNDINDVEELCKYYSDVFDCKMSVEEFGKYVQNEENGIFTDAGYISCANMTYYETYNGMIPDQYCVV